MKARRLTLSGLCAGESAQLVFKLRGCFTCATYEFVFDFRDPGWMMFRDDRKFECRADVPSDQLAMFDRILEDWRRHPEGHAMGTTSCEATITWFLASGQREIERFDNAFAGARAEREWAWLLFVRPRQLVAGGPRNPEERRAVFTEKRAAFLRDAVRDHPFQDVQFEDESTIVATLLPGASCDDWEARRLCRLLSSSCPVRTPVADVTCRLMAGERVLGQHVWHHDRTGWPSAGLCVPA